jgi:hypothetical protein
MRSVLLIGLVIVLLIVGILVMKNMGVHSNGEVMETEAKEVIDRAVDTKKRVKQEAGNIRNRLQNTD